VKTISIFPNKVLNNLFRFDDLTKDEQKKLAKVLKKLSASKKLDDAGNKPFKKPRHEYKDDESW